MGDFLDKAKDLASDPDKKEKLRDLARQHEDKIDEGIDRLADIVDERTGGAHSDKIDQAAERAKQAVDDLAGHAEGDERP